MQTIGLTDQQKLSILGTKKQSILTYIPHFHGAGINKKAVYHNGSNLDQSKPNTLTLEQPVLGVESGVGQNNNLIMVYQPLSGEVLSPKGNILTNF